MRFAVHWPGSPVASPRSHGVPRRDIPGRVHISVAGVSAGGAPEEGLILTRLRVHMPARRAPLARERGVDLLRPAGRLVLQAADQQAPPGRQDAPVQAGLGADVPPRHRTGSPGRAGHAADLQVLDADHIKPPGQVRAGLLGPVLAPVGFACPQPGDGELHSRTAVRAAPGPGQPTLQAPQSAALVPEKAGGVQQVAGGQGGRYCYAPVDAHHRAIARRRDRCGDGGEGDIPAACPVHRHPVGLHAPRYGAGPAEPHPPGLRHPDLTGFSVKPPHIPLPPAPAHDPESLVPPGLAPGRPPGRVAQVEERAHGPGEIPQRLLLHHLAARRQPRVLRPCGGKLPTLLQVARRARSARMPVLVLLDREVPHISSMRAVAPQHRLLGGRGEQPVPGHANTLAITADISGEVRRRLLLVLWAGFSTPRS